MESTIVTAAEAKSRLLALLEKWDAVVPGQLSATVEAPGLSLRYRSDEARASASLIKLVILAAGLRLHEAGELDLNERLPITDKDRAGGAGVLAFTDPQSMSIRSLMDLMISISDNTASNLLIARIGMANVNETARALNLRQTELQRFFWDAKAQAAGFENRMSTDDIVAILKLIAEPNDVFGQNSRDLMLSALAKQQFKAKLLDRSRRYGGLETFSKTGEMPTVEGDACILRFAGKTSYAAVVMNGPGVKADGLDALREIGDALLQWVTG